MASSDSQDIHKKVVVHPIVLLSAVDHYNRVAKNTKKRVVGMLLGETVKGVLDVTNSYAVPFEEDERDPNIWFLDHSFHESMFSMFKKVNAREKLIGWYSTGPKIRPGDLHIDQLVRRYTAHPVMVIIDVKPKELGLPTEAYYAVEEILEGKQQQWTFKHVPSEIGALEAEEVGVEHLLRDVKDMTISTLANQVSQKLGALKGLAVRLSEIDAYLQNVLSGRIPVNHRIIYQLQDVFNLLPNLNVEELVKAFAVKTNDMMLAVYLSSVIRSVVALHNLINNKLENKEKEQLKDSVDKEGKDKEGKEGKDKEGKENKENKENKEGKDAKDASKSGGS
uniref:MPN domain-containing protein n=1 Tax=Coccolithus braarudii TaxID=221442 RepID=A0A7S0L9H8_9EUKA